MGVETLLGPVASIGGALLGSDATSDAADAQAASTAAAVAENRRQYDLTRQDYAPYRNVGTNALRRLAALYGLSDGATAGGSSVGGSSAGLTEAQIRNILAPQYTTAAVPASYESVGDADRWVPGSPAVVRQAELDAAVQSWLGAQSNQAQSNQANATPQTYDDGLDGPIQMDPGYQFGLSEGQKAIDRKTAAAGGRVSGAAIKAANRYATDYATTGYNSAYQRRQDSINRLAALANIGQTSTGASAQAGQSMANNNAALYTGQGNANAAAALNQGNIWQNALNQAGASWTRRGTSSLSGPSNADLASMYNYG